MAYICWREHTGALKKIPPLRAHYVLQKFGQHRTIECVAAHLLFSCFGWCDFSPGRWRNPRWVLACGQVNTAARIDGGGFANLAGIVHCHFTVNQVELTKQKGACSQKSGRVLESSKQIPVFATQVLVKEWIASEILFEGTLVFGGQGV